MTLPNLSIQAILRENNRERLYVRPILWTRRQLQLLNCVFVPEKVHVEKGDPPSESAICTLSKYCSPIEEISSLREADTDQSMESAVNRILFRYDVYPLHLARLPFYFGRQKVTSVRVSEVFSRFSSSTPSIAHIGSYEIRFLRKRHVYRSSNRGKRDGLIANIHDRKLRLLEPRVEAEDPYIISILIALAQAQRRQPVVEGSCSTTANSNARVVQGVAESVKVTVLATPTGGVNFLSVYTATIAAEFLDRLDEPSQPLHSPCVSVKYSCIPLSPAQDALKQLHRLIRTGSCSLCAGAQPTDSGVTR